MALIWSQTIGEDHYELRSAGASLRLYRNGVNHSQWNPDRPLGGLIWDLIALPALQRPLGSLKDALVLGFGAGTVGRQLRDLAEVERIVGIELDPMHLSIAGGFFECEEGFELVAGDAVEWVQEDADEGAYDLIVDDLYAEEDGVPVRCAPMDADWCRSLVRLLRPGGLLVFNLIEPEKVAQMPVLNDAELAQRLPHSIVYHIDGYENRVLALADREFVPDEMKLAIARICRDYPRCYGVGRRYRSYLPSAR
jgi:predicted O-methyltransferase YrrM